MGGGILACVGSETDGGNGRVRGRKGGILAAVGSEAVALKYQGGGHCDPVVVRPVSQIITISCWFFLWDGVGPGVNSWGGFFDGGEWVGVSF